MTLERYKPGDKLTARDMSRRGDAINQKHIAPGAGLLVNGTSGSQGLSMAQRAPAANVPVIGKITGSTGSGGPPSTFKYSALAIDGSGRRIGYDSDGETSATDMVTPENERDEDVLYVKAATDDLCLMWWAWDGTPHLYAFGEIYDTVEDA